MDRGSSDIELMARGLRVQLQQSAGNLVRHDAVEVEGVLPQYSGSCSEASAQFNLGTQYGSWPSLDSSVDDVAVAEVEGDVRQHSGPDYDGGEDDEWYSSVGNEAAYCQAATESHNASIGDGVPGDRDTTPTQFEGQGSAMYSYHECGKMRIGTLNIRGSLRGASNVCAGVLVYHLSCHMVLICLLAFCFS